MQRDLIDGVEGWKLLPRGAENDQREHGGAQGPQGEMYQISQLEYHLVNSTSMFYIYVGEAQLQRRDQDVKLIRQEARYVISYSLSKFDKEGESNIPNNKPDYSGIALFRF